MSCATEVFGEQEIACGAAACEDFRVYKTLFVPTGQVLDAFTIAFASVRMFDLALMASPC